jgi:hypothetical protein
MEGLPAAGCEGDGRISGWTAPAVELGAAGFRNGVGVPVAYKLG